MILAYRYKSHLFINEELKLSLPKGEYHFYKLKDLLNFMLHYYGYGHAFLKKKERN